MTLTTHRRDVRRWSAPGRRAWLLLVVGGLAFVGALVAILIVALVVDRGHRGEINSSSRGSGVSLTDRRDVAPFTSVELAGTNTVVIHVGAPLSVAVSGDDNLVARVTTVVRSGRLVIDETGSFTTNAPMHVDVSVPSLGAVALSGTGTVTVDSVAGAGFDADLAGDGTVVVSGTTERLTAVLAGTGTLDLHDLVAVDGAVKLRGTGTVRVHATSTLDATLSGTGAILYSGTPTVTVRNTGTGTVVHE